MESSHPEATEKAIPYGLGVRVKRICSEEGNYRKHGEAVKDHLVNRGYEGAFVEKKLTKVDAKNREELLKVRGREKRSKRVPLVTTFSRGQPNIRNIFLKHLPILHASDRMKDALPEPPLVAYRRDANLEDILVHKKHNKMFFPDA